MKTPQEIYRYLYLHDHDGQSIAEWRQDFVKFLEEPTVSDGYFLCPLCKGDEFTVKGQCLNCLRMIPRENPMVQEYVTEEEEAQELMREGLLAASELNKLPFNHIFKTVKKGKKKSKLNKKIK
jgi:hypothetical protein